MADWESIQSEIITLLETVSTVSEVSNYEKSSFSSFPAVTVVPADEESEFEANAERRRIYAFTIRMYQEMFSQQQELAPGLKETDRILRAVVDDVVAIFDKPVNARFSGNADSTAQKVIMVEPVPSSWGYDTERNYRVATIILKVHVYVDTSQL